MKNIKETKQKQEKKEKIKRKVIKVINVCSYVLAILFILTCVVSCSMTAKKDTNEVQPMQTNPHCLVVNNDLTIDESGNDMFVNYNDTKAYYVYDSQRLHNANINGLNTFYLLLSQNSDLLSDLGIYSSYKTSNGWQSEFYIKRVVLSGGVYNLYSENELLYQVSTNNNFGMTGIATAQYFKFTINFAYSFSLNEQLQYSFSYMLTDKNYQYQPLYLTLAPYLEFTPNVRSFYLPFIFYMDVDEYEVPPYPPDYVSTTSWKFTNIVYEYYGAFIFENSPWGGNPEYTLDSVYTQPITLKNNNFKIALNRSYDYPYRDFAPSPKNLKNIVCSNVVFQALSKIGYWLGDIENRYYFNDMSYGDYRSPLVWLFDYYRHTSSHNVWESTIQGDIVIDTNFGTYRSLTLNIYAYRDMSSDINTYVDIHLKFGSTYVFHGAFYFARADLDITTNDYFELFPADSEETSLYDTTPFINRLPDLQNIGITYNVGTTYNKNNATLYAFLEIFTNTSNSYYATIVNPDVNIDLDATFNLISTAIGALLPFLTIAILPNITIGALILIPLAISIIIFVFKMFKR